ncbi:MAG: hypothetical protein WDN45_10550 [Caulobacteraceae bacterium]
MNTKTIILAAAAALALTVPAAAFAQPVYGAPAHGYRQDIRRVEFRRIEREREFRRAEELRRLRWEREHRHGHGYAHYR